jgi:hypothetical protein
VHLGEGLQLARHPLESSFRFEFLLFFFVSWSFDFFCFPLPSSFLYFFCRRSLSIGITLAFFFGSGETEKKLSFELSQLKAQLASTEVELWESSRKCEGLKKVCEGTLSSFCLFSSSFL